MTDLFTYSSSEVDEINQQARRAAQAAVESQQVNATSQIYYQSQGRVVVIGDNIAQEFATRLASPLHAQVVLTQGEQEPGVPVIQQGGRVLSVTGFLGEFTITLGEPGKPNHEVLYADIVVDMGSPLLLRMPVTPPGYFTSGTDERELAALIEQLSCMTGRFEKPRYFSYDASICAHGRAGQQGCHRCLDTCPAEAITSLVESIEVNPYLCQGGGVCASVCPSGAIRYQYPSASDMHERIRSLLSVYLSQGGQQPVVAFIAETDVHALDPLPGHFLTIVIEELASVGMEIWLSALAYGASAVILLDADSVPGKVKNALQQQLDYSSAILSGLGYTGEAIKLVSLTEHPAAQKVAMMPAIEAARFAGLGDKRQAMWMAIDHLVTQAGKIPEQVMLPDGAPMGTIHVDNNACTLCMSCTSVCPVSAVQAGNEVPRLLFHENRCVQCGICQSACPEQAITLQARLITDAGQRRQARVIQEEAPFACVTCGRPFATQVMITTMLGKLEGHSMFQNERARRRLMMCDDCRVVDIVQDQDAMQESGRLSTH